MSIRTRWNALYDSLPGAGRATIWILIAGICFTSMMAIARKLAPDLHIFVIVLFRNLFGMMFLSPLLIRHGPGLLRTKKTRAFILRGVCAFTGLSCYFFAATMIPLADIAAVSFTRPVFATIAAILVLGEVARAHRWGSIALGLIGALIVIRPGFQEINPGILFVFAAVVAQVINTVNTKYLAYTEHPDSMAIYQGIYIFPLAVIAAALVWQMPNFEQFGWLLFMGFIGALTQRALNRAYVAADATVVAALDFLRLPVAAVIGLIFFAEFPDAWIWLGGAVIVAGSYVLTSGEAVRRKTGDGA